MRKVVTIRAEQKKVILQHDNARHQTVKLVKTYLETLKQKPLQLPTYDLDIKLSIYNFFRSMAHSLANEQFHPYEDISKWLDLSIVSKDEHLSRNAFAAPPERR